MFDCTVKPKTVLINSTLDQEEEPATSHREYGRARNTDREMHRKELVIRGLFCFGTSGEILCCWVSAKKQSQPVASCPL